jgi:heme/copper-type cytochrome/quinol oxidase subunit 1
MALLRSILKWLIFLPLLIFIVLFALANRGSVTLFFDPFSSAPAGEAGLSMPLFALVLICLAVGTVMGGIGAWLTQHKHRSAERRLKREVEALRREKELTSEAAMHSASPLPPSILGT